MADFATGLTRIADILERAPEPTFFETTLGHVLLIIFGAFLTYAVQQISRNKETQRKRERQRRFLVFLLGDEIALRWNKLIAIDLRTLFHKFSIENVGVLCKTPLQPGNFYVLQQCAKNISLTTVFDDYAIVSHLIYIHVRINDFCDGQENLRQRYEEYNSQKTQGPSQDEIEEILKNIFKDLNAMYQEIDSHMLKIFAHIEDDYNDYITTSGFIRESQSNTSEVRNRLDEVAARRLPTTPL